MASLFAVFGNQVILATVKVGIEKTKLLENRSNTRIPPVKAMPRQLHENTSTNLPDMFENNHKRVPQLPKENDMFIDLGPRLFTIHMTIYRRPLAATRAGSSKEQRVMGTPERLGSDQPTRRGPEVVLLRDLNDVKILIVLRRAFKKIIRFATSLNQVVHVGKRQSNSRINPTTARSHLHCRQSSRNFNRGTLHFFLGL
jgi:hypothetical protein